MILIQMTGLSGAGKTTISGLVKQQLTALGYSVEVLDGDEYRRHLCSDLGFSKADRMENIRRLGFVGLKLAQHGVVSLLSAINPYEEARAKLAAQNPLVKTVYLDCPIEILHQRDVKGLYKRALLPESHPDYVGHFTGISDPYEPPQNPDLHLRTNLGTPVEAAERLTDFILEQIRPSDLKTGVAAT
jgi:adenylylsulfate kinase